MKPHGGVGRLHSDCQTSLLTAQTYSRHMKLLTSWAMKTFRGVCGAHLVCDDLMIEIFVIRKAALCYINSGDYGSAQITIDQCPPEEASTQYLRFLSAVKQGRSTLHLHS